MRSSLPTSPVPQHADPALDEALERIRELSGRLWQVRAAHPSVPPARWSAAWRRRRPAVCAGCGQAAPCPTLRATG